MESGHRRVSGGEEGASVANIVSGDLQAPAAILAASFDMFLDKVMDLKGTPSQHLQREWWSCEGRTKTLDVWGIVL